MEQRVCDDLSFDILRRLKDEREVVRCMCVSKSWQHIIYDVLRLRFLESPVAGLYFRTMRPLRRINYLYPASEKEKMKSVWISRTDLHNINYVSTSLSTHHERYPITNNGQVFDCCNGLLLMFDLKYEIYYVWNPFTRQRADIPKPISHKDILCAALAFDPAESSFYKVVLIACSTTCDQSADHDYLIDIFASETGEWTRTRLKLDSFFIRDSNSMYTVPRVYLQGVLYRMASSRKVSRIEVDSIHAGHRGSIDLPPIPVIDRTNRSRHFDRIDEWGTMGCLGVSMNCLSYCMREWTMFGVWLYNDQKGEWIPKYTVSFNHLKLLMYEIGVYLHSDGLWMEPFAVGPNSDVMFFGISHTILSYNFRSNELKLVYEKLYFGGWRIVLGCFFPVFTFRSYLLPFQGLDKKNVRYTPLQVAFSPKEIMDRNYIWKKRRETNAETRRNLLRRQNESTEKDKARNLISADL